MRPCHIWRIFTLAVVFLTEQACSSSDDAGPPAVPDASEGSMDARADASIVDRVGEPTDGRDAGEGGDAGADVDALDEAYADVVDATDVGNVDAPDGLPTGSCSTDFGCSAPTPRCHPATHVCVACLVGPTDNCSEAQYCDPNLLSCQTGCKSNASCATGVCSADHVCVECTPGASDACPAGKFCSPQFSCIAGCKGDAACASGKCQANHDCASCLSDLECAGGRVCSTGQCLATCSPTPNCTTGFTCCGDHCADLKRDAHHCGACDTPCTASQFCSPTACKPAILANICDSPTATVLLDGLQTDDLASATIQSGLVAACAPPPTAVAVAQATSGVIHPTSGKPVAGGGNMAVTAGGPFGQLLVKYLETSGLTPLYSYYDGMVNQLRGRGNGEGGADPLVVDALQTSITDSHSFFLVETVVDPPSGTLTLIVYGISGSGTQAAAWYFVQKMLPVRASLDKSWYVYEWTDQDANQQPGDADLFTLVASSP